MTDLLRYPVLALSPSGVDVYVTERDLVTCHRRAVKSTYEKLLLIDMDRDRVEVVRYRTHPLPPRRLENGRLNNDNVRVEVTLSEPERLSLPEVRGAVLEVLREAAGDQFDENDPSVRRIAGAKGMKELQGALTLVEA
ncbi:MAG: hypothetical protein ACO1SV_14655 [Fimbriimonas sp.]